MCVIIVPLLTFMQMWAQANLFVGACGILSANAATGASSEAPDDHREWYRVVISRTLALGRLHALEYSLETVQMVVAGTDASESAKKLIFLPLREVQSYCG